VRDHLAVEQTHDDIERFRQAVAQLIGRDPEHDRIGDQKARPDAEHAAPLGLVIELDDALCRHERMVVWQRDHAGAELDALGPLGGGSDEQLRRGDDLIAARVMLADPRFVVAELVEPFDELEVPLQRQGRVFVVGMKRRQEDTGTQAIGRHGRSPLPPDDGFRGRRSDKLS
jgi:hypothetical protein